MLRCTLARRIPSYDVVIPPLRLPRRLPQLRIHPPCNATHQGRPASSTADLSHSSLTSFLDYAKRTQLDRTSTTFAGTYYEYITQSLLRRYGFTLTRVGGRGDRGVDLKGTWTISTEHSDGKKERKIETEIPVVIQCKRLKNKVGPNLIRELEGALAGRVNTMGVLVGTKGATKGVRDAMGRSRVGICWVCVEVGEAGTLDGKEEEKEVGGEEEEGLDGVLEAMREEIVKSVPEFVRSLRQSSKEEEESVSADDEGVRDGAVQLGRVRQMLWNRAASAMGLEGLNVVMKYDGTRDDSGEVEKEVMLLWQGKQVPGKRSNLNLIDPKRAPALVISFAGPCCVQRRI